MESKGATSKDMSMTQEKADQRWCELLQLEAKRCAENYAAAEYLTKKVTADLQSLKQKYMNLEDIVT